MQNLQSAMRLDDALLECTTDYANAAPRQNYELLSCMGPIVW